MKTCLKMLVIQPAWKVRYCVWLFNEMHKKKKSENEPVPYKAKVSFVQRQWLVASLRQQWPLDQAPNIFTHVNKVLNASTPWNNSFLQNSNVPIGNSHELLQSGRNNLRNWWCWHDMYQTHNWLLTKSSNMHKVHCIR